MVKEKNNASKRSFLEDSLDFSKDIFMGGVGITYILYNEFIKNPLKRKYCEITRTPQTTILTDFFLAHQMKWRDKY